MKEKQNITIRIADQSPIALTIDRGDEETIRTAERNVNELWRLWCDRFTNKTPTEVLAMVAFRFAREYYSNEARYTQASEQLAEFEKEIDRLLAEGSDNRLQKA